MNDLQLYTQPLQMLPREDGRSGLSIRSFLHERLDMHRNGMRSVEVQSFSRLQAHEARSTPAFGSPCNLRSTESATIPPKLGWPPDSYESSKRRRVEDLQESQQGVGVATVARDDLKSMAAIVVNHCIQQGRLPLFGVEAIDLILHIVQQAIRDPQVISRLGIYAHADDLTRWRTVLQHADLTRLEIETEQSGATMASNYLNRKISERWSCKAKSLLKLIRPITSTPLQGSAIRDDRVLRAIGKWAGVSVGEVTLRQCVLGVWRVNKMLGGVGLKSDIQRARERVKGHSRCKTEFELARGMWEGELRRLEAAAHSDIRGSVREARIGPSIDGSGKR